MGPRLGSLDSVKYLIKFPNVEKHKKKPTQGPLKTTGRCQVDFVIFNLKIYFFPNIRPIDVIRFNKIRLPIVLDKILPLKVRCHFHNFFCNMFFFVFTNFSFFKKTGWNQQCQTRGPTIDRKGSFPCLRD